MNEVLIYDPVDRRWFHFRSPVEVISADASDLVEARLRQIEERVTADGLTAVGYVAYEAAPAFDPALVVCEPVGGLPLLHFGLFGKPDVHAVLPPLEGVRAAHRAWTPDISSHRYTADFNRIKELLAAGDTYQVNYSYRMQAMCEMPARRFFGDLVAAQPTDYATFIDTDTFSVCSASPELFFELDGDRLRCMPMKGTARRGKNSRDDLQTRDALLACPKNRAENVMIVDMIRNDMGRVAVPGSVKATRLFAAEPHPTVWQMTSTVEATSDRSLPEIFGALFPCASVTGAPKPRTMEIIAELEQRPRGVYTGAIGYIAPGRRARFSVAIRTATIDKVRGVAEYGVGGGVVWDSDAESELEESLHKSRVLQQAALGRHNLFETMRWSAGEGFVRVDRHLERLRRSAEYFGFRYDEGSLRGRLARSAVDWQGADRRVRLVLRADGDASVAGEPLGRPDDAPVQVAFAPERVNRDNVLLYHKTTDRSVYASTALADEGIDDVIFLNTSGEVTETTIANIVARIGGVWLTPPVSSGLLGGILRAELLDEGRIVERVLRPADLRSAEEIGLVNSLRGWRRATLVEAASGARPCEPAGGGPVVI